MARKGVARGQRVAEIQRQDLRLWDQRQGRFGVRAASQDHLGPCLRKPQRNGLADAGVGAGDQRALALQRKQRHRSASIATISTSR